MNMLVEKLRKFKDDKILFEYAKGDGILQKARYNVNTSDIHLIYDEDSYDIFLDFFKEMLGHELIHRLQYLKDKAKIVKSYKDISKEEDLIKYLSDKKEIMSHAWQTIQAFKMCGLSNKDIFNYINGSIKLSSHILLNNIIYRMYKKYFTKDSKVFKQYYKYMYEYLRG